MKKYTDKQKVAYYKKKLREANKQNVYGSGDYVVSRPIGRSIVRGKGAYKIPRGTFASVGKYLGGATGAVLGNAIAPGIGFSHGRAIGSELGGKAGSALAKIVGQGDYSVNENSLIHPDRVVPSFGEDSIRVKKREFVAYIDATTAFKNRVFPVNPGMSEVFPWLSSIAQNFEQYRVNGMIFQFVSTASDAIASTTNLGLGQVIMATDYNAADDAYVNAPQMLGSMFANSGKPSENIMHAIECAPMDQAQKLYYVRTGDIPSGTDIRLYDLCRFQLATQNMPANYTGMGQLWVSYDITFCKSQQNNQLGYSLNSDKYICITPNNGSPFGTSRTLQAGSDLGTTVTANTIAFPEFLNSGYYLISVISTGSSATLVRGTWSVVNGTFINAFTNNTASFAAMADSTSGTVYFYETVVRIDANECVVQLSGPTFPVSPAFGDLIITQLNGDIFD